MSAFKRTRRTTLTDGELMLFDALFDVWDTLESLSSETFSTSHNLPYTHGLDAAALKATTDRLIQRGLFRSRTGHQPGKDMTWLTLTAAGGRLWTSEREPSWDQFCSDSSWPSETGHGSWTLSVRSPRLETARAFLSTASRCGLYDVSRDVVTSEIESTEELIPWRTFASVYELRLPVLSPGLQQVDWALYEKERRWWRNIVELGTLRPNTAGGGRRVE